MNQQIKEWEEELRDSTKRHLWNEEEVGQEATINRIIADVRFLRHQAEQRAFHEGQLDGYYSEKKMIESDLRNVIHQLDKSGHASLASNLRAILTTVENYRPVFTEQRVAREIFERLDKNIKKGEWGYWDQVFWEEYMEIKHHYNINE